MHSLCIGARLTAWEVCDGITNYHDDDIRLHQVILVSCGRQETATPVNLPVPQVVLDANCHNVGAQSTFKSPSREGHKEVGQKGRQETKSLGCLAQ